MSGAITIERDGAWVGLHMPDDTVAMLMTPTEAMELAAALVQAVNHPEGFKTHIVTGPES